MDEIQFTKKQKIIYVLIVLFIVSIFLLCYNIYVNNDLDKNLKPDDLLKSKGKIESIKFVRMDCYVVISYEVINIEKTEDYNKGAYVKEARVLFTYDSFYYNLFYNKELKVGDEIDLEYNKTKPEYFKLIYKGEVFRRTPIH